MKKRTLFEFLFSRTGFGRTSWTSFVLIVSFVLGMAWGTWRNFNGKQG